MAVSTLDHNFDKLHNISADKDKHNGVLIGTDVLSCVASSTGTSARCAVAAAFTGGILYGKFTIQFSDGSLTGKVTGGTRTFAGATGTITGSAESQTREKVSIVYQT